MNFNFLENQVIFWGQKHVKNIYVNVGGHSVVVWERVPRACTQMLDRINKWGQITSNSTISY
jgi:hypothetical protein